MNRRFLLYFFLVVSGLFPSVQSVYSFEVKEISILNINSAITPGTFDYLNYQMPQTHPNSLIVIKMNTPGGLVSTTKDIITLLGRQNRPIAVWITPEGSSAASAGSIIASAAHFIFMSPGTNMGAATPVGLGQDIKQSDERNKAMNDLSALVRSLSHSRGRPSEPFEKMIKTAESYTDAEALKLKIIDGRISHSSEIEKILEGREFSLDGKVEKLTFSATVTEKEYEATMGQKLLGVLADPSLAYFLFLIGIALIYFEFQAPGGYVAGGIGFSLVVLAAVAFQVLPLDWGSMGLILIGIILLILEIFVTSYGLLSLAGLAAFTMGSLFLFHGDTGFISVKYPVLLSTLAGVFGAVGLLVWYLFREQKKQVKIQDFFLPMGSTGIILTKLESQIFQVKVNGEIWKATSHDDLQIGDLGEVISVDNKKLMLTIKKV